MKHLDYVELLTNPLAGGGGGGTEPTLIDKNISANGTYDAVDDNADGYQQVVVDVPPYGEGSVNIDTNGTHDVSGKASAVVDVPPYGEGSVNINTNGTHDVSGKASAVVNVPGITPSGSVTLTKNTDSNGVDVTAKAKAVVDVQGGAAYDYVWPYIPDGYTELTPTTGISRSTALNFTAGQTNKQVSARLPLSVTLTNGDKVAIHGTTSDTQEEFVVAGTVSGKTQYSTYQYVKLNIDYNGMVGIGTSLAIKANANGIDVRGRNTVDVNVQNSGTIQINQNGQGILIDGYKYADVAVPTGGGSDFTDLTGVRILDENGISADYRTPNTSITGLCFPDLENLNTGNFNVFYALTDIYFGPNFQAIKGMSFDQCSSLAGIYLDYYASYLPTIMNGYAPGMSTQCIYYLPNSLLQQAQYDQNWGSLYQQNRLVNLDQAPYSPVVIYQSGQMCVFGGSTWQNQGLAGHLGKPGVDPAWVQM